MAAVSSDKKFQAASVATAGITVVIVLGSWAGWWPGTSAQGLLVAAELGAILTLVIAWRRHRQPGTAREPVVLAAAGLAVLTTAVPMVAALRPMWFGLPSAPKEDNVKAVQALVEAVGTIGIAWFVRSFVTPGNTPEGGALLGQRAEAGAAGGRG